MADATGTAQYTVEQFAKDVQGIMADAADRRKAVEAVRPLLARLMSTVDLMADRYKVSHPDGRVSYHYYRSPDGRLSIGGPSFTPNTPTVVHNHNTWGVIGIYAGEQRTTRYLREEGQSDPEQCKIRQTEETVYKPGDIYFLIPPDDIHRIETVSKEPSVSIHVLGVDLSRQKRTFFYPEEGTCREVDGESPM